MPNERLRSAIVERGLTSARLAELVRVDPKTVDRWVATSRTPYRSTVAEVAQVLGRDPGWLWPETIASPESELVQFYPHRAVVPRSTWSNLLDRAQERIDVLCFAGLFFVEENPGLDQALAAKAAIGTRIRIMLGDPDSPAVRARGDEEGIGEALAAKVRNVLVYLGALSATDGIDLALHTTTLYATIYRFDDEMLVNTHTYGFPAYMSPVLHLRRRTSGSLFGTYERSLERVWQSARPYEESVE